MNSSVINQGALVLVLACSSLSIIPLIVVPGAVSFFAGLVAIVRLARSKQLQEVFSGSRKYFIAFIGVSLFYAGLIGVDIFNPHLYRHEFEYIVTFGIFIALSLLTYPRKTEVVVANTLVAIVAFSFFWFIFSLVDFRIFKTYLNSFYPFGLVWERGSVENIYNGPFQSHNSAGGFYAILSLLFLGMLKSEAMFRKRSWIMVALCLTLILFFFTDSRAYALSLGIVTVIVLGKTLYQWRKGWVTGKGLPGIYLGAVLIIFLVSASVFLKTHVYMLPSVILSGKSQQGNTRPEGQKFQKVRGVRPKNVETRLFLWKRAWKDFLESPIVGVGPARFDSDKSVIRSESPSALVKIDPKLLDLSHVKIEFLKGFLYRINVSKVSLHLEQEVHNAYLQVLAEGGIVMFAIFVAMYYSLARKLHSLTLAKVSESDLFVGLAAGTRNSLFCLCISSFFGSHLLGVIPLATVLAMSAYLISASKQADYDPPFQRKLGEA